MKKTSADHALDRYYTALRGPQNAPTTNVYQQAKWILAGPVAVALMLMLVLQSPSHADETIAKFIYQKQTFLAESTAPDLARRRSWLRTTKQTLFAQSLPSRKGNGRLS